MNPDLEARAADLAQIAVFNHCKECTKAHEACEPIKVEINSLKDRISDAEEVLKDIKGDIKNALIWAIGILLTIIGSALYIITEHILLKQGV